MFTTVQLFFAGLGLPTLRWTAGLGLIVGLVFLAYGSASIPIIGPYLRDLRSHLLWIAFGVAVFMMGHVIGYKDGVARGKAQQVVIEKVVTKAVTKTTTPKARRQNDRWDKPEH